MQGEDVEEVARAGDGGPEEQFYCVSVWSRWTGDQGRIGDDSMNKTEKIYRETTGESELFQHLSNRPPIIGSAQAIIETRPTSYGDLC